MAGFVYRELHDPDIVALEAIEALDMARQRAATVWVLYSFPRDMRLRFDELFDAIERDGELKAVFPGTAGDGALYVSAVPSSAGRRPD